mmetsp:Transcript_28619/g.43228  ORF Transcript_28619/g.43228 Transcript_28619/m.43228 type:complete len:108 (-) Transcript_28619:21-344(-)|eukprot:CAMPEP_0170483052 /NCGR_PEP_ID=MMETSP0208-20121228/2796_1 /TAXON_ID=197538 /ORGANISM="Strombidium inclinatum, Strain S3" /LENGTH=107 /DNA_ID=CAMNT_0010755951 /DNA_START=12 /DNA_END=335 /DNA_ORIENTATION=-
MNPNGNSDIAVKKSLIERKLEDSGEKAKLEEYLRQRLIECGWKDEVKQHCVEIIRTKGLDKINLEDLVEELLPKGRSLVPTKIKEDLLTKIKNHLEQDEEYKRLTGF